MPDNPYEAPVSPQRETSPTRVASITLTVALVILIFLASRDNFIGSMGVLSSPFWLPVCCYFVSTRTACAYAILSLMSLLLLLPLAIASQFVQYPDGFIFSFGLITLILTIATALGSLVAYSKNSESTQSKDQ